ncbi:hypothetical protein CFC21_089150, partial [Triticum aestivum]
MASLRASLLLVAVLCALAASSASAARDLRLRPTQFVVRGRVWCDTCRAGFETPASTFIAGAKVRVECKSRSTGAQHAASRVTPTTPVPQHPCADEHEHELCESVLVSSPDTACAKAVAGRRGPLSSSTTTTVSRPTFRLANALGFEKDTPLAACAQILKMYEEVDDRL